MMNKASTVSEKDVPVLGQKQSPVRWTIMVALPFLVFFVSMFLGRYDVSPLEVVKSLPTVSSVQTMNRPGRILPRRSSFRFVSPVL